MTHLDQEERVKGGRKGTRVLKILVISVVLLAAGYIILGALGPGEQAATPAAETETTNTQ